MVYKFLSRPVITMLVGMTVNATHHPASKWNDSSLPMDSPSMKKMDVSRSSKVAGSSHLQSPQMPRRSLPSIVKEHDDESTAASTIIVDEEKLGANGNDSAPSMPIRDRKSFLQANVKETKKSARTPDASSSSPTESRRSIRSSERKTRTTDAEVPDKVNRGTPERSAARSSERKHGTNETEGPEKSRRGPPERGVARTFSSSGKKSARGREKFLSTDENEVEQRRPASRSRSKSRARGRRTETTNDQIFSKSERSPNTSTLSHRNSSSLHESVSDIATQYGIQELTSFHQSINIVADSLLSPRTMKKGTRSQIFKSAVVKSPRRSFSAAAVAGTTSPLGACSPRDLPPAPLARKSRRHDKEAEQDTSGISVALAPSIPRDVPPTSMLRKPRRSNKEVEPDTPVTSVAPLDASSHRDVPPTPMLRKSRRNDKGAELDTAVTSVSNDAGQKRRTSGSRRIVAAPLAKKNVKEAASISALSICVDDWISDDESD